MSAQNDFQTNHFYKSKDCQSGPTFTMGKHLQTFMFVMLEVRRLPRKVWKCSQHHRSKCSPLSTVRNGPQIIAKKKQKICGFVKMYGMLWKQVTSVLVKSTFFQGVTKVCFTHTFAAVNLQFRWQEYNYELLQREVPPSFHCILFSLRTAWAVIYGCGGGHLPSPRDRCYSSL